MVCVCKLFPLSGGNVMSNVRQGISQHLRKCLSKKAIPKFLPVWTVLSTPASATSNPYKYQLHLITYCVKKSNLYFNHVKGYDFLGKELKMLKLKFFIEMFACPKRFSGNCLSKRQVGRVLAIKTLMSGVEMTVQSVYGAWNYRVMCLRD